MRQGNNGKTAQPYLFRVNLLHALRHQLENERESCCVFQLMQLIEQTAKRSSLKHKHV